MPAAYSHYRLGQLVLDELNQPLKHVLETNQDLFDIGLHGPDILFYNRPYIHSKINRLGSAMHKERADIFFYQALEILKETKSAPQFAYLCGFICHYILLIIQVRSFLQPSASFTCARMSTSRALTSLYLAPIHI